MMKSYIRALHTGWFDQSNGTDLTRIFLWGIGQTTGADFSIGVDSKGENVSSNLDLQVSTGFVIVYFF